MLPVLAPLTTAYRHYDDWSCFKLLPNKYAYHPTSAIAAVICVLDVYVYAASLCVRCRRIAFVDMYFPCGSKNLINVTNFKTSSSYSSSSLCFFFVIVFVVVPFFLEQLETQWNWIILAVFSVLSKSPLLSMIDPSTSW